MSTNPNKLSLFWQELKRRKVFRVVAMYAASAFILLEVVDIVAPALLLPSWTVTLVVVLLAIGFPIAIILAWIFDLTPEGVKKTVSIEAAKEQEIHTGLVRRKLRASDVIIAVLIIVVGILLYPRIFKNRTNLKTMTLPITVVNEFGEKENRRIFKKDYISRLAIFPFEYEEQDSSVKWIQGIIYNAIIEDYLQYYNIIVDGDWSAIHLNEQIEFARSNNIIYFLTGSFRINQGNYKLTSRLYQTKNGSLLKEWTCSGNDLLSLIDSICHQSRYDLGISKDILNLTYDLPIAELMTNNLEAYRHYIVGGMYDWELPTLSSHINLNKAALLDSTFAQALYVSALYNYNFQNSHESAVKKIDQAMRHRHRLSEYRDIAMKKLYFLIHEETEKAIALAEMQYELNPHDYRLLETLISLYRRKHKVHETESALQELNKVVPDHPNYKILLAESYLYNGKYSKGIDVLDKLLKDDPENTRVLLKMGEVYLHMNDLEAASEVINRAILLVPEEKNNWSVLIDHIEYVNSKKNETVLNPYIGIYQIDNDEQRTLCIINNDHLYFRAENQPGFFGYPISDTVFVSAIYVGHNPLFIKHAFFRDKMGEIKTFEATQSNASYSNLYWKEDTLIQKAKKLFIEGKVIEALDAFQIAYDQNPEQYYLANFIQSLEFIQSPGYKKIFSILESYTGEYGDLNLYIKDNQFFYTDKGFIYRLLPLSENKFMIPSNYRTQIYMMQEGKELTGLKFVYIDGNEKIYTKN